jgi:uncharacterized protein (TIGR02453 family)
MAFKGFGSGAWEFYRELAANNDRSWFKENRARYEREVLDPAIAFTEELGTRLECLYPDLHWNCQRNGSGSIMRIHRDVRFSHDKSPYKTNLGLIFWIGQGKKVELPVFYFHLEAKRSFFFAGWHQFPKDALGRYRAAVDDPRRGAALDRIMDALEREGLSLFEDPVLKKVPRGYEEEHPRALYLRLGGIGVGMDIGKREAAKAGLPARCAAIAKTARPLMDWLLALA